MPVPEIDKLLGMEAYATTTAGTGGKIKASVDDFIVEELLVDGSKASVHEKIDFRVLWSTQKPQRYLLCVLIKRNWDTFAAVKKVATALGINQEYIQFAGIKDAKAKTAQHITVEKAAPENLTNVNVKDLKVLPIGYMREKLSLFYLLGNDFTITVKSMNEPEATIREGLTQTMQRLEVIGGIPNFYGHQRFGTTRPITHLVGKALIQGDFEEAAMLFLANPSFYEHPASRQARQSLQETQDFKAAMGNFPRQLRFERLMLNHLAEHTGDFRGAFQRLPPKLQALFVQAHQSYIFNRFLSGRILSGLSLNEAVPGDFVVAIERSGLPLTAIFKVASEQNLAEINSKVKAGKMRVALPIVGIKQKLSSGLMGQIEMDVLEQEEAKPKKLQTNELVKIGGKGGLRAIVTPISDFKLQNIQAYTDRESSVTLSFMLLRGSYATVALREIIKPCNPVAAGF